MSANKVRSLDKLGIGKDAIIVSQRKVRKEGIKGYFTPKMIEVTAALDRYNKDNEKKQSMDSIKALIYNKQEEQKRAIISVYLLC